MHALWWLLCSLRILQVSSMCCNRQFSRIWHCKEFPRQNVGCRPTRKEVFHWGVPTRYHNCQNLFPSRGKLETLSALITYISSAAQRYQTWVWKQHLFGEDEGKVLERRTLRAKPLSAPLSPNNPVQPLGSHCPELQLSELCSTWTRVDSQSSRSCGSCEGSIAVVVLSCHGPASQPAYFNITLTISWSRTN